MKKNTKRKKAEERLKESEKHYRQLADSLPPLVWETDARGNQTYASKRWKEFTGLDPENTESFAKMVHPDDMEGIVKVWSASLATGKTYRHEVRLKSKEGKYHWFQVHGEPLYDDDNKIEKWVGAFTNITERKEAEEKIKINEEKFSTLADNMENLAWIADGEGWIYWYNKRWYEYTGTTLEEMQGWGWEKVHHPEHKERVVDFVKQAWKIDKPWELTFPLRKHTGGYNWFLTRAIPVTDANGKILRWLGTNTDITKQMEIAEDLRKTKEQLELTFRNVPAAIYHFDKNGKILYLNKKGATQMGYTSVKEVLAEKDIFQFRKKLDKTYLVLDSSGNPLPIEQSSAAITFRTLQPSEIVTEIVNKATCESLWLLSKSAPLFDEAGKLGMVLTTSTDITFQKIAEQEIRAREKELQKINDHFDIATSAAEVGTWSLDIPTGILEWSALHKKMWGYDEHRTDLVYEDWHTVILPEDKELTFEEVARALKNKTIYEASYRIHRADNGMMKWMQSSGKYFYNEAGEPVTLTGITFDITEQKKAEIALKESENLYHNLIYSSPSAIGILEGEDLVITTANDAIIEIWGKGKQIMGKKYFEALPELAEQGYREVFAEVYKTGIPFNAVETPIHILQKGKMTLKYYNFLLYPQRNIHDVIEGIGIIATEVTSQALLNKQIQESEKRFRLLADSMPQHIWTADVKGNLNYFNQSVFDYSGLSLDQIIKDGWLQIVHPDDREENIKQWTESVTKGTDFLFEHRFKKYDGEYRWQLSRAVPQKDAQGNITLWVGTSTDIQKIKEEERRKGDFIKMVSHELKTPVTSIKGYVQLLLMMLEKEKQMPQSLIPLKSSLTRIDSQVLRLTRLITEMLDLSRIETGKLELQKEFFYIDDLVSETVQDILQINLKQQININSNFNARLYGDKDRIGQVLINIINNGIKYSPGSKVIDITVYEAPGKQVAVSVRDYGIGIDKKDQQKIFERFYRASGEEEKTYPGFGIGLFIASEIIERHDGYIKVESEPGKGSLFTFFLPVSTTIE